MEWKLAKTKETGQVVATLVGDCDMYAAPAFHTALSVLLETERLIHLDFSGVPYLDSSGVGAIIKLLQKARTAGGSLTFSGISGAPRKVLAMANILPLLKEKAL